MPVSFFIVGDDKLHQFYLEDSGHYTRCGLGPFPVEDLEKVQRVYGERSVVVCTSGCGPGSEGSIPSAHPIAKARGSDLRGM